MARLKQLKDGSLVPLTAEEEAARDEYDAMMDETLNGYAARRQQAYGPIANQLDMIYHDKLNGTTTWEDHIAAVKAQYPKK